MENTQQFSILEDDEVSFYDEEPLGGTSVENNLDSNTLGKVTKLYLEDDDSDNTSNTSSDSSNHDSDILTQEEKLRVFSDKVISAIVGGKSISSYATNRLLSSTSPLIFRNENFVIFSVIYNYRDRIKSIEIDSEFLSMYLDNNRKLIENSRDYLDIHAYGEVDGSSTLGYISGVVKHFNRLCSMEELTESQFDLYFEKYIVAFKSVEAQRVYDVSRMILTDGLKVGSKILTGFEDSYNYSRRKLAEIEGLVDMNQGTGFMSIRDVVLNKKTETTKSIKIADFDKLEALTKHYGGIYTKNFYQVLAPPKAGKSKFCARVCHTAVVRYGVNVTVWAQEGGNDAWTAQMRAIHFDYSYNEGVSPSERKSGVDQDTILHDKFKSDELRELEETSCLDLVTNTDYGNIEYIDRPFEVETFLDEIDTSIKSNNSKLLIIDYLQLIGSKDSRVSERERISKAYKALLNYCKKNNIAVLTPAQYKQDTVDDMLKKSDLTEADMRTAGGGSAEVFRTPDIIFSFWSSTADLRNNKMTVMSVPCRFNKPFDNIECFIDLSTCNFVSLSK